MERQTSGIFLRILAVLSLTGSLITVTAKVALSFDQQGKTAELSRFFCSKIVKLPLISARATRGLISLPISNYSSRETRESISLSISYYDSIIDNFDTQIFARQLANHYLNFTPVETVPENLTDDQGIAVQAEFLRSLKPYLGNIIGYKAALTNKIAQKRFNVSQPVLGFLLEKMLLKSGANVSANFGAIPRLEGDLIIRVSSEKINQAKTPAATLKYLDAVIPFLELPDLIYASTVKVNGSLLQAVNAGARLGVVGQPIPLNASEEWEKRLSEIEVIIFDESGKELARSKSSALLGNPLKVVFWIKNQLQQQGKFLKKGDLLSLGSITPLLSVVHGKTIYARYFGLTSKQPIEISVHFY